MAVLVDAHANVHSNVYIVLLYGVHSARAHTVWSPHAVRQTPGGVAYPNEERVLFTCFNGIFALIRASSSFNLSAVEARNPIELKIN